MTLVEAMDAHEWSPAAAAFVGWLTEASATSEDGLAVIAAAAVLLARHSATPADLGRLGAEFAQLMVEVGREMGLPRRPALHVVGARDGE